MVRLHAVGVEDISWLRPQGTHMTDEDWTAGFAKSLMVFLNGAAIAGRRPRGERIEDNSFLLLFNAHHEDMAFRLPGDDYGAAWSGVVDTAAADDSEAEGAEPAGSELKVRARSLRVLRRVA